MNCLEKKVSVPEVFKALGHPTRIEIVREVMDGEKCVCELVEHLGLAWSTVSRHLSVMREACILSEEKRGVQVFYKLNLQCAGNFIRYIENEMFREQVDRFVQQLRKKSPELF